MEKNTRKADKGIIASPSPQPLSHCGRGDLLTSDSIEFFHLIKVKMYPSPYGEIVPAGADEGEIASSSLRSLTYFWERELIIKIL